MGFQRTNARRKPPAFTLVELLAVVLVVALLLTLTLHGLSRSRIAGRETVSLSNLRQHAANFTSYTSDSGGFFPWFTDPDRALSVCNPARSVCAELKYWDACDRWNMPLASAYYGGNHLDPSFYPPGFVNEEWQGFTPNITRYLYPYGFLSDWRYWDRTQRLEGSTQWRATRSSEVAFSSAKALVVSSYPFPGESVAGAPATKGVSMACVDGHAETVEAARQGTPYTGSVWPGGMSWKTVPGMTTEMGVRGRDIK